MRVEASLGGRWQSKARTRKSLWKSTGRTQFFFIFLFCFFCAFVWLLPFPLVLFWGWALEELGLRAACAGARGDGDEAPLRSGEPGGLASGCWCSAVRV